MSSGTTEQQPIFREYIDSAGFTDFPDIINPNVNQFHYVLAFAKEVYKGNTGTGSFNLNLDAFAAQKVEKLKAKYKNVKIVISIGGRGGTYPFYPESKVTWLQNARESLGGILRSLNNKIDGIDVNYEVINSSENDFVNSIGELIQNLRRDGLINVVSIAPSQATRRQYLSLYRAYTSDIDLVDYQFYNENVLSTPDFVRLYNELSRDYQRKIILAGFSTDPNDKGRIPREIFLEGCQDLINKGSLRGIFVWNANHSTPSYEFERAAQQLITTT